MQHRFMFLLVAAILAADAAASSVAFTRVTTVDPGRGLVREDQTVIVEDGRIERVGKRAELSLPSGITVIDGAGQFLVPGLADMHVHLEHFDTPDVLRLFLAHGVTLVRQMDGRPRILGWREAVREGRLEGPEIVSAGPVIDGDPPAESEYAVAVDAEGGVLAVAAQAAAGYDLIKVYHGLSEAAFESVISESRQIGLPVTGHVPWRVGIRGAVAAGLECIEHMDGFDDLVADEDAEMPEPWHWRRRIFAYRIDRDRLAEAAAWLASERIWNVPTLSIHDWRWLDPAERERLESRPSMDLLRDELVARWRPKNWSGDRARQYGMLDERDHEWIRVGYQNARAVVTALHDAGARLMLGTDTPNPYVVPGDSVHDELANLVAAGLSPMAALATATARPAEYLGRPDIGCLHEGCQADLVMLEDDPLANIRATRSISGVMVDGRWRPIATLRVKIGELSSSAAQHERAVAQAE